MPVSAPTRTTNPKFWSDSPPKKNSMAPALEEIEVSGIFERMPADHAAEVVEEMPPEHAGKILDLMPEAASEEIPGAPPLSGRHRRAPDVTPGGRAVRLGERGPDARAPTADRDVVRVRVDLDQEEVARTVAKYDLVAVPVVDHDNTLVGTIAVEDVIDIIKEEASEDIFRLAGSDAAELERRPPMQIALMRLPWTVTTLAIELVAGLVIHHDDATLSQVILLASFMPVIQAISGNSGLQSVTIVVRGLARATFNCPGGGNRSGVSSRRR